jgi:MFS family permease
MAMLAESALQRALRLSVAEGCAWALMLGLAESYFIAIGIHLGAGAVFLGLLVSLPLALGALGPLGTLALLHQRPRRRRVAVSGVAVQVAILGTLALLLGQDLLALPQLIIAVCLYQVAGQAAGTAWASWYGDMVPAHTRGRWFTYRNRFIYLTTCVGLLGGGLIMHVLAPGGTSAEASPRAFSVLLGLAAIFRLVSCILLLLSPEPEFRGLLPRRRALQTARTRQGGKALRILAVGSMLHFTVYWSSPYFAPFMLQELQFTYLQYMTASLAAILAKMAFSLPWGRAIDRHGARGVYLASIILVGIVPLPWVWAQGLGIVVLAQLLSGASWSGLEVGYLSLLLENSRSRERPYLFALQSLGHGAMQLAGALTGSLLILPLVEEFRMIFAISAVGRLAVGMSAWFVLADVARGSRATLQHTGWRVFGLRSHGGFSVRPVLPSEEQNEGDLGEATSHGHR